MNLPQPTKEHHQKLADCKTLMTELCDKMLSETVTRKMVNDKVAKKIITIKELYKDVAIFLIPFVIMDDVVDELNDAKDAAVAVKLKKPPKPTIDYSIPLPIQHRPGDYAAQARQEA